MNDPMIFTQRVPTGGFRFLTFQNQPERYLTSGIPINRQYEGWVYNPMRDPGLFRTFAALGQTEDDIVGFANKCGALGIAEGVKGWIPVEASESGNLVGVGEPLSRWKLAIVTLNEAVRILDAVRSGDLDFLGSRYEWVESEHRGHGSFRYSYQVEGIISEEAWIEHPVDGSSYKSDDLTSAAMRHLQRVVNDNLEKLSVTARLLWDSKVSTLSLRVVPSNLLGCLWLQLATTIDGNKQYRQCAQCRKWIEFSKGAARTDKSFCSPTCRANAHREKIARARKMATEGLATEAIAASLKTEVKTVKGWLAK